MGQHEVIKLVPIDHDVLIPAKDVEDLIAHGVCKRRVGGQVAQLAKIVTAPATHGPINELCACVVGTGGDIKDALIKGGDIARRLHGDPFDKQGWVTDLTVLVGAPTLDAITFLNGHIWLLNQRAGVINACDDLDDTIGDGAHTGLIGVDGGPDAELASVVFAPTNQGSIIEQRAGVTTTGGGLCDERVCGQIDHIDGVVFLARSAVTELPLTALAPTLEFTGADGTGVLIAADDAVDTEGITVEHAATTVWNLATEDAFALARSGCATALASRAATAAGFGHLTNGGRITAVDVFAFVATIVHLDGQRATLKVVLLAQLGIR